jgi:hypothetical protein
MRDDLVPAALAALDGNRRGAWTCPAAGIYPHQWLWDSGFVAIGLARHDPRRAAGELTALLRGQWSNGMIPHVVFAEDGRDVASRRLWGSRRDPRAPVGVDTSCITQPPVLAIAARRVADHLSGTDRQEFLRAVVPRLLAHHAWLYRERDPHGTGLVTLLHPWECGLDTSPPWMAALRRVRPSAWLRIASALRLTRLVRAVRRDTRYLPARERASDDDGLRMLDLASRARRRHFDLARLAPDRSLLLHDVSFNALLVVANRDLVVLARDAGVTVPADLRGAFDAAPAALETLWDDATDSYCARDATNGDVVGPPTIAQFTMLWAGEHPERLARLVARLRSAPWWPQHPVPSIATDAAPFDPDRYWSGPTWVNTNWLIVEGLRHRNEHALAEDLLRRTLALVDRSGFAEYFSPRTGAPLGATPFSWTAALAIDLATRGDGTLADAP